jgi:2-polyprenyl-6-methoxyphenol hydroxylase-like FAD-dependent oxidoreductase
VSVEPGLRSYAGPPAGGRHAVIIGSGLAGLLAARVATEHFEQVTVVDRDRFPDSPDHRKGVPQSHHAHGLLPRGREIIESLFPGIEADLRAEGGTAARDSVGVMVVSPAGPLPVRPIPAEFVMFSRLLLEWQIRRRLARLSQVRFLPGAEVVGLASDRDGTRVRGVRLRFRHDGDSAAVAGDVVPADLVIDCSGRSSKAPDWLRDLGYGEVPEEVVNSGLSYSSRFYARPDGFPDEWKGLVINGRAPHNPRAGLLLTIENGLWHVTLGRMAGDTAPADDAAFLQWARELADPSIYEAIRVATPVSPIRGYRTPTNRLRRFERLRRWPAGFVVTGDAVCAFNPIYGQGMTVAAMDALVLAGALTRHAGGRSAGFERAFQADLARNVATPWFVATSEDLRWPGVELTGARPSIAMAIGRRYMDRLLRAAVHDPDLTAAYLDIIFMVGPPRSAFAPWILARVVRGMLGSRRRAPLREFALSADALAAARRLPDATVPTPAGAVRA